jgi:hypothetical protein
VECCQRCRNLVFSKTHACAVFPRASKFSLLENAHLCNVFEGLEIEFSRKRTPVQCFREPRSPFFSQTYACAVFRTSKVSQKALTHSSRYADFGIYIYSSCAYTHVFRSLYTYIYSILSYTFSCVYLGQAAAFGRGSQMDPGPLEPGPDDQGPFWTGPQLGLHQLTFALRGLAELVVLTRSGCYPGMSGRKIL